MNRRYRNIEVVRDKEGVRYYTTNQYPEVPPLDEDFYVITTEYDRYDLLAQQYYGDVMLWWVIPAANNLSCDSMFPPSGMQIRIPADTENILEKYNNLNRE